MTKQQEESFIVNNPIQTGLIAKASKDITKIGVDTVLRRLANALEMGASCLKEPMEKWLGK